MHPKISILLQNKKVVFFNVPADLETEFPCLETTQDTNFDVVFAFAFDMPMMKKYLLRAENLLIDQGMLYLCYPKTGNKRKIASIHRDEILPFLGVNETTGYATGTRMRFTTLRSFDDDFTIVGVRKDRKGPKRPPTSKKNIDYSPYIKKVEAELADQACLAFFRELSPGYQRYWARYIYSAKQEATQRKRIASMIDLLNHQIKVIYLAPKKTPSQD